MNDILKEKIEKGFIDEDGKPLKCHKCGCTEFELGETLVDSWVLLEYEELCQNCKTRVGYWAYGCWQL